MEEVCENMFGVCSGVFGCEERSWKCVEIAGM